jgi:hypothetical protein
VSTNGMSEEESANVTLPTVDARLFIRGVAAMAVLTGTGFIVFVSFYPLLLLAIGTLVHPSIREFHFAFIGAFVFGAIVLVLAVWIGKFVFSRFFASFAWRIASGICLTTLSAGLVKWLGPTYLATAIVYAAFLTLSVRDAATRREPN